MLLILLACSPAADLDAVPAGPVLVVEDHDCAPQGVAELEAEPVALVSVLYCDDVGCWANQPDLYAVLDGSSMSYSCGWSDGDYLRVSYFVH